MNQLKKLKAEKSEIEKQIKAKKERLKDVEAIIEKLESVSKNQISLDL